MKIFILPIAILFALVNAYIHWSSLKASDIRAFHIINWSIVQSNAILDNRNNRVEILIEYERRNQPEKVDEVLSLVKQVRSKSKDIDTYINGLVQELNESQNEGDLLIVNKLLADGKDGEELFNKLNAYKKAVDTLMSKYPLPYKTPMYIIPPPPSRVDRGHSISVQIDFFHNISKIAAITILNKFDNDVKNTEAMCIDRLILEVKAPIQVP